MATRKRQSREGRNHTEVVPEIEAEAEVAQPPDSVAAKNTNTRSSNRLKTGTSGAVKGGGSSEAGERSWVQCNKCSKWRSLPCTVDLETLPEIWFCKLNKWDSNRMTCEAEQEKYQEEEDAPLKSFFKLWLKRLRNADKMENRLPSSAVTRGRKRRPEVEWIRCSNPTCGKWRALSVRGVEASQIVKRLNRDHKWADKKPMQWFCSMNSWDETKASCTAPQESLFDAPWNVGRSAGDS